MVAETLGSVILEMSNGYEAYIRESRDYPGVVEVRADSRIAVMPDSSNGVSIGKVEQ